MSNNKKIMAAAIQLNTSVGDISKNLESCKRLAFEAYTAGANWIALPEFFNTGMKWDPKFKGLIENESGASASFLKNFSEQYSIVVGGSFLCRLRCGAVRNRYLCFSNGDLIGRHDKDYPTMWENAFYEGGDSHDTGELGGVDGVSVGSILCWEFIRTATSRRLQGKVDIVLGGSYWWSIPSNWPDFLFKKMKSRNKQNLLNSVKETAALIGAPVIHASHCNTLICKYPSIPGEYRGYVEGCAAIIDAKGEVLALREREQGEGFVMAEVTPGAVVVSKNIPSKFWLRSRGWIAALSWYFYGFTCRRWYKNNIHKKSADHSGKIST